MGGGVVKNHFCDHKLKYLPPSNNCVECSCTAARKEFENCVKLDILKKVSSKESIYHSF